MERDNITNALSGNRIIEVQFDDNVLALVLEDGQVVLIHTSMVALGIQTDS